jgi:phosphoglycolate phosphatase
MWEQAKRAGSRALALDPHSLLGLRTVIYSWLNGTGDLGEAKRVLASSPPESRMANFCLIGNMASGNASPSSSGSWSLMKGAALVFDLDGTLVDSVPDLRAALNEVLGGMGRRELTPDEARRMVGDGTRALVERALAATGTITDLEAAHQGFLKIYEAAPAKLSRLYPGVAETLESLRASGARLAICTNKPQRATLGVLEGFAIGAYFDAVLGGDAVPFRKPDPRHLQAAIERLGARASEAAMIGDNENDYAAARAAGVPVILMRYGYLRVPPETLAPDAWLDHFSDIPQASKKLIRKR